MKGKIALIIVSLLLLIAIPITYVVVQQQQEIRQKAAPATTLSLGLKSGSSQTYQKSATKNVGDEFDIDILLSTGDNQVLTVDAEIPYDSTKLELLSVEENRSLFPNALSQDKIKNGVARLLVSTVNVQTPFTGDDGVVGTLRFKALAPTNGALTLRFSSDSNAFSLQSKDSIDENRTKGVLVGSDQFRLTIGGAGIETTTSITPTASPLPTRTTTATPTTITTGTPRITSSITPTSGILNLSITTPISNSTTQDTTPTFTGKAKAGSTISLAFSPGGITDTTTTDSSGNWSYTITQPLTTGAYTVVITANDLTTGQSQASTVALTITQSTTNAITTSTPTPTTINLAQTTDTQESYETIDQTTAAEELPVTGTTETTLALFALGVVVLLAGAALPFLTR